MGDKPVAGRSTRPVCPPGKSNIIAYCHGLGLNTIRQPSCLIIGMYSYIGKITAVNTTHGTTDMGTQRSP